MTSVSDLPVAENTARELRVAGTSPPADVASAISHAVYDGQKVVLRAIGAGAVNQAVKAIAIAQGYVGHRGLTLVNRPGFVTAEIDGKERTAIVFHVFCI